MGEPRAMNPRPGLCFAICEFPPADQHVFRRGFGAGPEISLEDTHPAVTLYVDDADRAQQSPPVSEIEEHAQMEEQESPIDTVVGESAPVRDLFDDHIESCAQAWAFFEQALAPCSNAVITCSYHIASFILGVSRSTMMLTGHKTWKN